MNIEAFEQLIREMQAETEEGPRPGWDPVRWDGVTLQEVLRRVRERESSAK